MTTQPEPVIEIENERRLIVRRVDEHELLRDAIAKAFETGKPSIFARHGGSVANKYGWPADTEGALAIAFPDGRSYVEVVRLPANKVTLAGVFNRIFGEYGLFDCRFSAARKALVREKVIAYYDSLLS